MKQFQFSVSEKEAADLKAQIPYWLPVGEAAKQLLLSWSRLERQGSGFNAERYRRVALALVGRPQEKAAVLALSLLADSGGGISCASVRLSELLGWGRRNCEKVVSGLVLAGVCRREDGKIILTDGVSE